MKNKTVTAVFLHQHIEDTIQTSSLNGNETKYKLLIQVTEQIIECHHACS